jgi:hypothetical protein
MGPLVGVNKKKKNSSSSADAFDRKRRYDPFTKPELSNPKTIMSNVSWVMFGIIHGYISWRKTIAVMTGKLAL